MDASDEFVNAPTVSAPLPIDESELAIDEPAPSRRDLLRRAAELGPRMTWESVALTPADPILGEKQRPDVAERRERLRKIVKGALGACIACCVLALVVTAFSGSSEGETAAASGAAIKSAPAVGVVSVESLEGTPRPRTPSSARAWSAPHAKQRRH